MDESMSGERYVDGQGEINWEMRQTLVDWLLQVHLRYHLLQRPHSPPSRSYC